MFKFVQKLKSKKKTASTLCGVLALLLGYVSYNFNPEFYRNAIDLIYYILQNYQPVVPYVQ